MATLIDNHKAGFDYEILETLEAGVVLLGYEVKALRARRGSLRGAFVSIRNEEAYLKGAEIPAYQPKNTPESYNPRRERKLLLNKKEIKRLLGTEKEKRLTLIPLSLYSKANTIKAQIAIARGKKKRDKRETIKKREADRDIHRSLKRER